jgi:L-lactate dehydrogenase complex protein LldF
MIPLPTLLRGWRDRSWREGLEPRVMRAGLGLWGFFAAHPRLYCLAVPMAMSVVRLFRHGGWIARLPLAEGWTAHRDLPAPAARTFMAQYRTKRKGAYK